MVLGVQDHCGIALLPSPPKDETHEKIWKNLKIEVDGL